MKRILVAPLNWGLGHASRCIPLIKTLHQLGAEVILASDGAALQLLRAEFPDMPSFALPSYRIHYRTANMVWNIAQQLPRILYAIRAEHQTTARLVREHGINGIISDNRYGCFSSKASSVMLTHQLKLRVPGPRALEWSVNALLGKALARFDAVWVPDYEGAQNLSGELAHTADPVHRRLSFIGPLTRMRHAEREQEYDVAVVLSGPEPQRTILEQRLMEQALGLPHRFIFIQGKTKSRKHHYAADNVEVVSYLTSRELNDALSASEVIVCRSGYSSIMDLAALGKKAILIPTPGQTEQEYLAEFFSTRNIYLIQSQEKINLEAGLEQVGATTGLHFSLFPPAASYEAQLQAWLDAL
ncbi:MAG TPA: glycosyltransferase [Saprospiraceae bacterium]|nr:glycosyltransferase [Saprospiraceae bacterium]HNM26806.1 glycosyltransferase [Saprospiraceae bacterium]